MDKYQTFINGFKEGRLKDQQNAINFLFDKILPGIKDILSSYEDDGDQELIPRVIVYDANVTYPVNRDQAIDHSIDRLSIRIMATDGRHIENIEEIRTRILSEFGEYLGVTDQHRSKLEFYLIRSPFKYK